MSLRAVPHADALVKSGMTIKDKLPGALYWSSLRSSISVRCFVASRITTRMKEYPALMRRVRMVKPMNPVAPVRRILESFIDALFADQLHNTSVCAAESM